MHFFLKGRGRGGLKAGAGLISSKEGWLITGGWLIRGGGGLVEELQSKCAFWVAYTNDLEPMTLVLALKYWYEFAAALGVSWYANILLCCVV